MGTQKTCEMLALSERDGGRVWSSGGPVTASPGRSKAQAMRQWPELRERGAWEPGAQGKATQQGQRAAWAAAARGAKQSGGKCHRRGSPRWLMTCLHSVSHVSFRSVTRVPGAASGTHHALAPHTDWNDRRVDRRVDRRAGGRAGRYVDQRREQETARQSEGDGEGDR